MIIWLASYPRSGNSLLTNLIKHHLGVSVYSVYREPDYLKETYIHLDGRKLTDAAKSKDIFFVKTHEQPSDTSATIYLFRDGRDAIVSYARYILDNRINLPDPLPENPFHWALDILINGSDQFGGWGNHLLSWTSRGKNTVTIRYEDLLIKEKQAEMIKSALSSLGVEDLQLTTSDPFPEFSKFHKQVPDFYRKGEPGSWVFEMPYKYHLGFWERYGSVMQKFGYKKNEGQDFIRSEFVTAEVMRELNEKLTHIANLTVNLNNAIAASQSLTIELLKEREEKKLLEANLLQQLEEARGHFQKFESQTMQSLMDKEQVIQNFRQSWLYTFVHGPFRHLPIFAKLYRGWGFLKRKLRHYLTPHIGVLYQYEPRPSNLPANYFSVRKLIQPVPVISIVTPSYNYAHFIERTLKSAIYQGYPELEYIIQDGGSTDETVEVVKRYKHHLKHFESQKDRGQSHAINLGFQHATGEIMAYLNADDVLLPGALDYVAHYFSSHPEVDVVYGHRLIINEDDLVIGDWIMPPHDDEALRWGDYIPQETLFWRRHIWEKAGGKVDEDFQFAMDWDLLLRFQEAGAKFKRLPRFLAAFRVHMEQKTSTQVLEVGEKEVNRLRLRNFGREVNYRDINDNLRLYRMQSVLHFWLHKLAIKKQQWTARLKQANESRSWYEPESVYFYSLHKAGTSLFTHVLRQANELIHVDYETMLFDNELSTNLVFKKYGHLYGVFRIVNEKHTQSYIKLIRHIATTDFVKDKNVVCLVRDPRDIIISLYYSMGFSHTSSFNTQVENELQAARDRIKSLSLDEFALRHSPVVKERFEILYKLSKESKNSIILRYEDLLEDFDGFLCDFSKYISIPRERQQELFIASRPRDDEDLKAHKRSGKSGQYLEKLKPETVRELNQVFKPVLENFGYEVGTNFETRIKKK